MTLSLLLTLSPLAHWVPAYYDNGDTLVGGCSECYPQLWVWPSGAHSYNLTGVFYGFWSPPPPIYGNWAPRSKRTVSVNYWGDQTLMARSGFQEARMSLFGAVPADSIITVAEGGAILTSVSDTLIKGLTWQRFTSTGWTVPWDDTTYWKLVPEGWTSGRVATGSVIPSTTSPTTPAASTAATAAARKEVP